MLAVARESRLVVGYRVLDQRNWPAMQELADDLPPAGRYCSDDLSVYSELLWPDGSTHVISQHKDEIYTIESINADLRTYLGRLKRRSRCFSRCMDALRRAVRLFIWHYNRRRRAILANPKHRYGLPLLF